MIHFIVLLGRSARKIRLEVHNDKQLVPTYNVIGFIRGQVEPDRYVIYGNHRDGKIFLYNEVHF